MRMTRRFTLLHLAAICAIAGTVSPAARATNYTWVPATGGTWNTSTANWNDGVTNPTTWTNGSGNTASFNPFAAIATINLATNIVTGTLSTNGGATVVINGAGTLDVTNINTAGAVGSNGSIDMFAKITGNHGLTITSTGAANNQGRLNLKAAADYTGDTFLVGTAYLLMDTVNNSMPAGTTLNMAAGTTLRFAKNGLTQEIAGLSGAGTITATSSTNVFTINTKSGVATTYSGAIQSSTGLNLVIAGSGTQALTGSSLSYNGSTTVSAGTLLLGSNLTNTSGVTVSGGNLQSSVANVNLGVGTVSMSAGSINIRGTGAAGKFTLASGQDFAATGGTLFFDLDSVVTFDQIVGSGAGSSFSLTNTTLSLNLMTWTPADYSNTYALFSGFVDPGAISNLTIVGYDTANYTATLSDAGILSFTAVPEPASATLLALGGVSLLLGRGRRRNS